MSAMKANDPYERILHNMREYPNDIPMVNGEASDDFRQYIKLLFSSDEAQVAQHLVLKPAPSNRIVQWLVNKLMNNKRVRQMALNISVIKIARKIGKSVKDTKQILEKMTDEGVIQDIGGYSYFLTMPHLFNIGFKYSKALKRLGKRGAELYQQFFIHEKFYK